MEAPPRHLLRLEGEGLRGLGLNVDFGEGVCDNRLAHEVEAAAPEEDDLPAADGGALALPEGLEPLDHPLLGPSILGTVIVGEGDGLPAADEVDPIPDGDRHGVEVDEGLPAHLVVLVDLVVEGGLDAHSGLDLLPVLLGHLDLLFHGEGLQLGQPAQHHLPLRLPPGAAVIVYLGVLLLVEEDLGFYSMPEVGLARPHPLQGPQDVLHPVGVDRLEGGKPLDVFLEVDEGPPRGGLLF